jgi:hypothetical protein
MKFIQLSFMLSIFVVCLALTVEEAWKNYQNKPFGNKEKIVDFEQFKSNWDKARAINDEFKTTEEAWKSYKSTWGFKFNEEEDSKRFQYFKVNWEKMLAHNERFAIGETNYPEYLDFSFHFDDEEKKLHQFNPETSPM